MIKPILALAATAGLLAACGNSETTGPVEGPAVATSQAPGNDAIDTTGTSQQTALTPGANSFTEAQAREAIAKQGYTDIGTLSQDENGIWSAPATLAGAQSTVSVDFKGVVTAQ